MAKQGSTLAGMMGAVGAAISLGLKAGAPAEVYISKLSGMRFAPAGRTDDPELLMATLVMDYAQGAVSPRVARAQQIRTFGRGRFRGTVPDSNSKIEAVLRDHAVAGR